MVATGGVRVRWINCADSGTDPEVCGPKPDPAAVIVQILAASASTRQVPPNSLGFAEPADRGDFGGYVCVFYGRVESLAGRQSGTQVLLGHVIAHELGHLLLGMEAHSRAGIMAGTRI